MSEKGKQVARTSALPPEVQREIDNVKALREASAELAKGSWGANSSPAERAAVARYAMELDLNPMHVIPMGGKPYITAEGYIDKMLADPRIEDVWVENISDDPEQRKKWGVPDFAIAAYVGNAKLKDRPRIVQECNYAPKKKGGKDGVGDDYPHLKARTTTMRRLGTVTIPMWTHRAARLEREIDQLHREAKTLRPTSGDDHPQTHVTDHEIEEAYIEAEEVVLRAEVNRALSAKARAETRLAEQAARGIETGRDAPEPALEADDNTAKAEIIDTATGEVVADADYEIESETASEEAVPPASPSPFAEATPEATPEARGDERPAHEVEIDELLATRDVPFHVREQFRDTRSQWGGMREKLVVYLKGLPELPKAGA